MENEEIKAPSTGKTLSLPVAIVIAGVLIAAAIFGGFYYYKQSSTASSETKIEPVSKSDFVRGNIKAPIKIVVYTDPECPYCKIFHETLNKVYETYGKTNQVAIVYRLFPLPIHSQSKAESQAALCAGKIGGNDAFWSYMDKIFATTPGNNRLDLTLLPKFATELNLDKDKFASCTKDAKMAKTVDELLVKAAKAGASGTPFPIFIYEDQIKGSLPGALPFEDATDEQGQTIAGMKTIIDSVLSGK